MIYLYYLDDNCSRLYNCRKNIINGLWNANENTSKLYDVLFKIIINIKL
jgi:hypothetical protein